MEKMDKMFKTYDDKYLQAIVMYGFNGDTKLYYDEAKSRHVTTIDEMKELIPSFDPEKPTNRQKILICSYVKELYDHRDRMYNNGKITSDSTERIRYAIQSMMLKETLRG